MQIRSVNVVFIWVLSISMRPHSISDVDTARFVAEVPSAEKEGASQDCCLVGDANFQMVLYVINITFVIALLP